MCLKKSFRDKLVNGSQGYVCGFSNEIAARKANLKVYGKLVDGKEYPVVNFFAHGK